MQRAGQRPSHIHADTLLDEIAPWPGIGTAVNCAIDPFLRASELGLTCKTLSQNLCGTVVSELSHKRGSYFNLDVFILCVWVFLLACVFMSVSCMLVLEVSKGQRVPWNWCYRWSWAMVVWGTGDSVLLLFISHKSLISATCNVIIFSFALTYLSFCNLFLAVLFCF